jgi:hypothetical protein
MQVSAFLHWNTLHWEFARLLNKHRHIMALFKNSSNLDFPTAVTDGPILQAVNPHVETITSKCGSDHPWLGNANKHHTLPNSTLQGISANNSNGIMTLGATRQQHRERRKDDCENAHRVTPTVRDERRRATGS